LTIVWLSEGTSNLRVMRQICDIFWKNCQLVARCFLARRVDVAALFSAVFAFFEPEHLRVSDSVEPAVHRNALLDVALSVFLLAFAELQVPVATKKSVPRRNFFAALAIAHHASEHRLLLAPDGDEGVGAGDAVVLPVRNARFSFPARLFQRFAIFLPPADPLIVDLRKNATNCVF
jgi:hypothetical protein